MDNSCDSINIDNNYNTWDNLLDECCALIDENWGKNITHENCIDFCFHQDEIRHSLGILQKYPSFFESPDRFGKKEELARKRRNEGNILYKQNKFEECISKYTDSIFLADPEGECLPLAYSNRAKALYHLNHMASSLSDLNLAFQTGYPREKAPILKLMKAKILKNLGKIDESKEAMNDLINDPFSRGSFRNITKLLEDLSFEKTDDTDDKLNISSFDNDVDVPVVCGGINKNYTCASSRVGLFYDKKKGRHVKAIEHLNMGDVLFVEKPFAHVYFSNVCHECGKSVLNLIPCDHCTEVSYCSVECRDTFWKSTHSFECGYGKMFESVGIAHLSLRVVLAASSSLTQLKEKLADIVPVVKEEGQILRTTNGYIDVYNLEAHLDEFKIYDVIRYVLTAYMLALYLKNYTDYFPSNSSEEDMKFLVSVLWRHIAHLICNGSAISSSLTEESIKACEYRHSDERLGTAIYPSVSMMNHSCEPSVVTLFYGKCIIVRAAKAIKKGEEIFNCYGPHWKRMSRWERQKCLKDQYFFSCDCPACSEQFDFADVFTAWKCPNCTGPSVPENETFSEQNCKRRICLSCCNVLQITNDLQRKENELLTLMKDRATVENCVEIWRMGREIYYKFHGVLGNAALEAGQLLAEAHDLDRSIKFRRCCFLYVEKRFGSNSIELARESLNLGQTIYKYWRESKGKPKTEKDRLLADAVKYIKKAMHIYKIFCGETSFTRQYENFITSHAL